MFAPCRQNSYLESWLVVMDPLLLLIGFVATIERVFALAVPVHTCESKDGAMNSIFYRFNDAKRLSSHFFTFYVR